MLSDIYKLGFVESMLGGWMIRYFVEFKALCYVNHESNKFAFLRINSIWDEDYVSYPTLINLECDK